MATATGRTTRTRSSRSTRRRSDLDMKFNQALGSGNLLVGDKVNISLDISAVKVPEEEAR